MLGVLRRTTPKCVERIVDALPLKQNTAFFIVFRLAHTEIIENGAHAQVVCASSVWQAVGSSAPSMVASNVSFVMVNLVVIGFQNGARLPCRAGFVYAWECGIIKLVRRDKQHQGQIHAVAKKCIGPGLRRGRNLRKNIAPQGVQAVQQRFPAATAPARQFQGMHNDVLREKAAKFCKILPAASGMQEPLTQRFSLTVRSSRNHLSEQDVERFVARVESVVVQLAAGVDLAHLDYLLDVERRELDLWGNGEARAYDIRSLPELFDTAASHFAGHAVGELAATLDPEAGKTFGAALAEQGGKRILLLVGHHLVLDAFSLETLRMDLVRFLRTGRAEGEAQGLASRALAMEELVAGGGFPSPEQEAYWAGVCAAPADALEALLPDGADTASRRTALETRLEGFRLEYAPDVRADLLSALACALHRQGRREPVCLALESHGRDSLLPGFDFSRSLGWFTAVCPMPLVPGASCATARPAIVRGLSEHYSPESCTAYGYLRARDPRRFGHAAQLAFNYLGKVVANEQGGASLVLAALTPGAIPELLHPDFAPDVPLELSAWFDPNGVLRLGAYFSPAHVDATLQKALATQSCPLESLINALDIERDVARNPVFDVFVALEDASWADFGREPLRMESLPLPHDTSKFDLSFYFREQPDGAFAVHLEYCTELFRPETIELMAQRLCRLADAVLAGGDVRVADLDMLPQGELARLAAWNDTAEALDLTTDMAAPNPEAQAGVITRAARNAGVPLAGLQFFEAHGTATVLGDPVEIEGLRRAFASEGAVRPGKAFIGSVKGNLGHLDAAAGAIGLAKAVLSLEKGFVPPQPHFERPNPHIDFASAPVRVPQKLEPLPAGERPWRCGVSSFGLSGVNTHAAGLPGKGYLLAGDRPTFEAVLAPKMAGAWNVHNATLGDDLAFFVMASSRSALVGAPGQSDYTAGNAFLNAFAHYRRNLGLPALSICWNAWSGVGMAARSGLAHGPETVGMLAPEQALDVLEAALASGRDVVVVGMSGEDVAHFSLNGVPRHGLAGDAALGTSATGQTPAPAANQRVAQTPGQGAGQKVDFGHVLCLDAQDFYSVVERNTGLSSTEYWEHLAEPGGDRGWKNDVSGEALSAAALDGMAQAIIEKCGLAGRPSPSVLDVGSGSGRVARALAAVAGKYAAVDLARNELDRVSQFAVRAAVTAHRIEAGDIQFLDACSFDCIVVNGVAENFPGYNYLRRVLDRAVDRLGREGVLFVGAVRDLDARDALRAALREHDYEEKTRFGRESGASIYWYSERTNVGAFAAALSRNNITVIEE